MSSTTTCKICSHKTQPFAVAQVLGRHQVQFFQCGVCGFVQTEEPYWLPEAYQQPTHITDLGMLARNNALAMICRALVALVFNPAGRFIDYGAGHGILVRLLRDAGLDWYYYDQYARNLFAPGAEADLSQVYELLTAFEVFEHLPDPMTEIRRMLQLSRNVLFTTELVPQPTPEPEDWWYYGLHHGQHVAFYTRAALEYIAHACGATWYSNGYNLHLFAAKPIPVWKFRLATHRLGSWCLNLLWSRPSLTPGDYERLTRHTL